MDSLLNNPVLFTILIIIVVLIAAAVLLYFFVFKDKVNKKITDIKKQNEEKAKGKTETQSLASKVFEKQKQGKEKISEEEMEDFEKKFTTAVNQSKNERINSRNFKSKTYEEPEEEDADGDFDLKKIMSQYSSDTSDKTQTDDKNNDNDKEEPEDKETSKNKK